MQTVKRENYFEKHKSDGDNTMQFMNHYPGGGVPQSMANGTGMPGEVAMQAPQNSQYMMGMGNIPHGFIGGASSLQNMQGANMYMPTVARFTPMDFELYLNRNLEPTQEMRCSSEYYYWYHSKVPRDPRAPPPLSSMDTQGRFQEVETGWDSTPPPNQMHFVPNVAPTPCATDAQTATLNQQQVTQNPSASNSRKFTPQLLLNEKSLLEAQRGRPSKNPYEVGLLKNEVSPVTAFNQAYARTPVAGVVPEDPKRQASGEINQGNPGTLHMPVQQQLPPQEQMPDNTVSTSYDMASAANNNALRRSIALQQYYTQEPLNPYGGYDIQQMSQRASGDVFYGAAALSGGSYVYAMNHSAGNMNAVFPGMATHVPSKNMMMMMPGSASNTEPTHRASEGNHGGNRRGGNSNASRGGGRNNGRGHNDGGNAQPGNQRYQPCSELLRRFRIDTNSKNFVQWQLADIRGHAVEFAKDQEGSRFIQGAVDTATPTELDLLFSEIFENPQELVTDIFGNYVLQKMLEKGNNEQLIFAAKRLSGHVVKLTLQTYGCRVIQKCIEVMPDEGLDVILSELEGNVAKCIQDQNGNHVVQKCVEVIPQRCGFIISAFAGRVMELATHAYGCRVIQCIMEHCPDQEDIIFNELLSGVETLAQDQYGNYVIQHLLQHAEDQTKVERIYNALKPKYLLLSKQKFASNVMEKLFARSNPTLRMGLVDLMCSDDPEVAGTSAPRVEIVEFKRSKTVTVAAANAAETSANNGNWNGANNATNPKESQKEKNREQKDAAIGIIEEVRNVGLGRPSVLCQMMNDQYANYVVQRVLDASEVDQFVKLVDNIERYVIPIRTYNYGRPIIQRLARRNLIKVPGEEPETN